MADESPENQKYKNGKLLIKPAKDNIKSFLQELKQSVKSNYPLQTDKLIHLLNEKIVGWTNYYRNVVSSKAFAYVDKEIFKTMYSWSIHRHPNKGKYWIVKKYFTRYELNLWRFHAKTKDTTKASKLVYLKLAAHTKIKRHSKILGSANPFNPIFRAYFEQRGKKVASTVAISLPGGT